MKKVLIVYFSQSGQLKTAIDALTAPLLGGAGIRLECHRIEPDLSYPYPWPFYAFFDAFPEAVFMEGCAVQPLALAEEEYDLIILGYTVWFLSPSIPVTGFLKSAQAARLFKGKPVVTLIACRDMWLLAQEKIKKELERLGAQLIDNVVLTDQGRSLYSFVTTPRWLFTGRKDPFWFFPAAGVAREEIAGLERFGSRLCTALENGEELSGRPLLRNLGAVNVNGKLIAAEQIGQRSFRIWGRLIKAAGQPGSLGRKVVITIYAIFLLGLILTVVPLSILIRTLIYPLRKKAIARAVTYYEQPSGR